MSAEIVLSDAVIRIRDELPSAARMVCVIRAIQAAYDVGAAAEREACAEMVLAEAQDAEKAVAGDLRWLAAQIRRRATKTEEVGK